VLDQALGLFDHHFRDLNVARRRFVEGRGHHLALHRALHVGDFLRPLVDQQNDQVAIGMVGGDGMGDVLQQHRLTGARRRDDQPRCPLPSGATRSITRERDVLAGRIVDFHLEPLVRIQRRQIVEMILVTDLFRIFEIDRVDLQQGEVPLAILRPRIGPSTVSPVLSEKAADLEGEM
jgi:hypothetical protein